MPNKGVIDLLSQLILAGIEVYGLGADFLNKIFAYRCSEIAVVEWYAN